MAIIYKIRLKTEHMQPKAWIQGLLRGVHLFKQLHNIYSNWNEPGTGTSIQSFEGDGALNVIEKEAINFP